MGKIVLFWHNSLKSLLILAVLWGLNSCAQQKPLAISSPSLLSKPVLVSKSKLLPFFDDQNNPVHIKYPTGTAVDVTPRMPVLNAFDRAVLKTCGNFGERVSPEAFKNLLKQYPQVWQGLKKQVGGEIFPGRSKEGQFLEDLTYIFFQSHGFEHIFCGEISANNQISGLHYVGRYWDLQNQGIAGRLPKNERSEEVIPNVAYTVGVELHQGKKTFSSQRKGYAYVSDAEELLEAMTVAYKGVQTGNIQCLVQVKDSNSNQSYPGVFVLKNNGIVTFYPDVTPNLKSCRI